MAIDITSHWIHVQRSDQQFLWCGIVTILMYDNVLQKEWYNLLVLQLCNKSESVTSYILHQRSKTQGAVLLVTSYWRI